MKKIDLGILFSLFGSIGAIGLFLSGCSLFIGSIKPVEEKSENYSILDLSQKNPDWMKLDPKSTATSRESAPESSNDTGISDVVYQSKKNGSIVSLNSACKTYKTTVEAQDLRKLSKELLLGISNIKQKDESQILLNQLPALSSTVEGKLNDKEMKIKVIVLQRNNCVYDLMYISTAETFSKGEKDFSLFVHSLNFK